MKPVILTILKSFALFIFWLIFPPIFFELSIIWKMPKKIGRVVLSIIAPLNLLILIIVVILAEDYFYVHIERGSKNEIETTTGLDLPSYEVIEERHSLIPHRNFNGDFEMSYTIKLDTTNIYDFYKQVEELIAKQQNDSTKTVSYWKVSESGDYHFSTISIHPDTEENLSLDIDKKNAEIRVIYGAF